MTTASSPTPSQPWYRSIAWPWLVVLVLMVCFIWGNSLVPGEGSGSMSQWVTDVIRSALAGVGLPNDWVTNFVVRKTAHFTEYMVLGIIAMQAFRPHRTAHPVPLLITALVLVLIPSLDETIQLFVGGRAGQVADVMLDCAGALTGVLLTLLASWLWRRAHR